MIEGTDRVEGRGRETGKNEEYLKEQEKGDLQRITK